MADSSCRHCEEHSDVAIQNFFLEQSSGLPRLARNDDLISTSLTRAYGDW